MTLRSAAIGAGALAALTTAAGVTVHSQQQPAFDEALLKPFTYRNLGPFRMGARTSDIAVPDAPAKDHLYTFYVGFWTGGLWKTTNNGTTFEPVFDGQAKLAIGDVAIAPSNGNVVWVGTGDAFTSRSSYAGDGVYKSTDAGKTWKKMGLADSHHIARIAIHPTNPDIVYVAAMGHLYSENSERGVFKTTNGGTTWEKVLFVNDRIGVIDLVMNPKSPDVLYAATYDKQRLPWQMVNGGPESGIYKTTDGGRAWTRLRAGLPEGRIGRIGLDIFRGHPDILYAVIENQNPRVAAPGAPAPPPGRGGSPATYGGQVYRTDNAGALWTQMSADDYNVSPKGPYYFSQIFVDPGNDKHVLVTQDGYRRSLDGGRTWNAPSVFPRMFGDFRTLWFDPQNPDRMIAGSDGGIAITYDGGRTSDHFANLPVAEIYAVGVDMEDPYNIYAGLQDHEHWKGPSNGPLGRVTVWDWLAVGDNDGMFTQVDPKDSRWLYTTRQYGGHSRVDQKLGYETDIWPRRAQGDPYRFQWITPLHISPHDSNVIYAGAQMLLRSPDRGATWTEISPDLSTSDKTRILPESEGGVPGGIPWFAITSISESPLTRGVIWAGTSDGKLQVTRNDGGAWSDVTARITAAGGREDAYVSRVRASSHLAGRAYVAKNGYRFDDFKAYLYRTDDFGATWTAISATLPAEPINVVLEDQKNPDLLFVGNDAGVFVSIDRGARWVKMNNNIPNIAIHDLVVHPRENDLVLGSYGRGLWVTNIGPLQELSPAVLAKDAHLFSIKPVVQRVTWVFGANDYLFGQRHFSTPNEPNGMVIRYYLKNAGSGRATVVISDATGQEVAKLQGPADAGINTVVWNTRRDTAGGGRGGGGRGGPPVVDLLMPLGEYRVTVDAAGTSLAGVGRIVKTQGWSIGLTPQVIR
jgi:photosystem II stability/assembly factor-like uncharacterized protein